MAWNNLMTTLSLKILLSYKIYLTYIHNISNFVRVILH